MAENLATALPNEYFTLSTLPEVLPIKAYEVCVDDTFDIYLTNPPYIPSRPVIPDRSWVFHVYRKKYISNAMRQQRDREVEKVEKSINDIVDIDFDWVGRGFEKPTNLTLTNAIDIVKGLLGQVYSEHCDEHSMWFSPSAYSDESGYVYIGWQKKGGSLYFCVKDDEMEYSKSSLSSDEGESGYESGQLNIENCLLLWKRFINE